MCGQGIAKRRTLVTRIGLIRRDRNLLEASLCRVGFEFRRSRKAKSRRLSFTHQGSAKPLAHGRHSRDVYCRSDDLPI